MRAEALPMHLSRRHHPGQRQFMSAQATYRMTRCDLGQFRRFHAAPVRGIAAARMEMAARRRVRRIRDIALKHDALRAQTRIGHGNGG